MFERFTDGARRVVVLAQEESRLLNHDRIGTEHLLLGLLNADDESTQALRHAGATLDGARRRLERSPGRDKREPHGHIPFTRRAKTVLELALRASQRHGQQSIGPPQLLCALLEVGDGTGVEVLVDLGVDTAALAAAAEQLGSRPVDEQGGAAPLGWLDRPRASAGFAPQARHLTADARVRQIGRLAHELAAERNELGRALRRYARHEDGCDPARGCSCGLAELLRRAAPEAGDASQ